MARGADARAAARDIRSPTRCSTRSRKFALPIALFENHIAARQFDLYDDAMPSLNDLEGYCGETASSLFQLAALILAEGRDVGAADASGHAGVAYAITGLLRALPLTSARGQVHLPLDLLERHGVSPEDVRERRSEPGLAAALRELSRRRGRIWRRRKRGSRRYPRRWRRLTRRCRRPGYLARLERGADAPFGAPSRLRNGGGNGRYGAGRGRTRRGHWQAAPTVVQARLSLLEAGDRNWLAKKHLGT